MTLAGIVTFHAPSRRRYEYFAAGLVNPCPATIVSLTTFTSAFFTLRTGTGKHQLVLKLGHI